MNRSLYSQLPVLIGILIVFSACQQPSDVAQKGPLDDQLESLLSQASSGKGKAFFQLPEATDFSQIPQDRYAKLTQICT